MNRWMDRMDGKRGNNTHTHKILWREWMNKIIDLNGWGFVNALWNEDDDVD